MERVGERNFRGVTGKLARWTLLLLLGLAGTASACSSPSPSRLERSSASVNGTFGFVEGAYSFQFFIFDTQAGCTVAQTAKVTINGDSYPIQGDCSIRDVRSDDNAPTTIHVEDEGNQADMTVSGLFPGMHATLTSPANGITTPGSDVVIEVPPELQNQTGGYLYVFDAPGVGDPARENQSVTLTGTLGPEIHFTAPANLGLYHVSINLEGPLPDYAASPDLTTPVASCSGFKDCVATVPRFVGPLSLTVLSSP